MEYRIVFYETEAGEKPVLQFLESLRGRNSILHKLVTAGLVKLRYRANHGPPLTAAIQDASSLYELRVGRTDIARVFFFFRPDQEIVCTHGYVKKTEKLDRREIEQAERFRSDWERRYPPNAKGAEMTARKALQAPYEPFDHVDGDDLERYIATFTDDERHGLAAAEVAIDMAILLHRIREQRGLTQGAAAELAGLQQQAVSRLERPSANPQLETVRTYLGALGYRLELHVIDLDSGDIAGSLRLPAVTSKPSA